jgi:hypothetical protein
VCRPSSPRLGQTGLTRFTQKKLEIIVLNENQNEKKTNRQSTSLQKRLEKRTLDPVKRKQPDETVEWKATRGLFVTPSDKGA